MFKSIFIFTLFFFLLSLLQSCVSSWYTLQLETDSQPIQLGSHHLNVELDTLGIISGKSIHEFEEDTYSESEVSYEGEGTEKIKDNINTMDG